MNFIKEPPQGSQFLDRVGAGPNISVLSDFGSRFTLEGEVVFEIVAQVVNAVYLESEVDILSPLRMLEHCDMRTFRIGIRDQNVFMRVPMNNCTGILQIRDAAAPISLDVNGVKEPTLWQEFLNGVFPCGQQIDRLVFTMTQEGLDIVRPTR